MGVDRDYLDRTPFAQELRPTINKKDLIKLKRFCTDKEATERRRNTLARRKSLSAIHLRGLISRVDKYFKIQESRKQTPQLENELKIKQSALKE